jgi:uncharacterized membrane protein required for colicin V production
MVWTMRSRASFITATLALAICFVCPLVEMFDQWDHTLQTGNDTEYFLVLLALCVGAAFVLAQLIVSLSPSFLRRSVRFTFHCVQNSSFFLTRPIALASVTGSPPLTLRI